MIKISIIIPAYNVEKYIGDCLKKILTEQIDNENLRCEDVELIVVNDGSTDSTKEIVEPFTQSHENIILINKKMKEYA